MRRGLGETARHSGAVRVHVGHAGQGRIAELAFLSAGWMRKMQALRGGGEKMGVMSFEVAPLMSQAVGLWRALGDAELARLHSDSLFGWLVADGWCWFVLREEYCWLVAGG
jgi:hypothetical protein